MATTAKKKTKKKSKKKATGMSFNIPITQDHIDNATPGDSTQCAGAVAVRDHFEGLGFEVSDVRFDGEDVSLDLSFSAKLPKNAQAFVEKFDSDAPEASDFTTEKYSDGEDNPKFKAAQKKWDTRVKPFSFAIKTN